jgi:hypothetical protein
MRPKRSPLDYETPKDSRLQLSRFALPELFTWLLVAFFIGAWIYVNLLIRVN